MFQHNLSAADVTVAAGRGGEKGMHVILVVIVVIAAVAGVVYFVRERRNRSATMTAEDGSDSWTRSPGPTAGPATDQHVGDHPGDAHDQHHGRWHHSQRQRHH